MGLRTLYTPSDNSNEAESTDSLVTPSTFSVNDCFSSRELNENVLGSMLTLTSEGLVMVAL